MTWPAFGRRRLGDLILSALSCLKKTILSDFITSCSGLNSELTCASHLGTVLEIYPGVICEAGPELTPAICVQRFYIFLYIEIFLFVKISEIFIYITVRTEGKS